MAPQSWRWEKQMVPDCVIPWCTLKVGMTGLRDCNPRWLCQFHLNIKTSLVQKLFRQQKKN